MMHAIDIIHYEHELKAAGVPEKQAEIHAAQMAQIVDNNLATNNNLKTLELVTKQDIKELEFKIDTLSNKVDALNTKINAKIDATDTKLTWLISLLGVFMTFLTCIQPFLHHH